MTTDEQIAYVMGVLDAVDWMRPRIQPAHFTDTAERREITREAFKKFGPDVAMVAIGVIIAQARRDLDRAHGYIDREWIAMHDAIGRDKP